MKKLQWLKYKKLSAGSGYTADGRRREAYQYRIGYSEEK